MRTISRLFAAVVVALVGAGWSTLAAARAQVARTPPPPIDGQLGHIEKCEDFFVDSVLSPLGDLFPQVQLIPLLGTLFHDNDVPDMVWVRVNQGVEATYPKFRNVTGVVAESPDVGDYPNGGFRQTGFFLEALRSPLGDEAVVNFEDFPDVHDSHDMNFFLKLDEDPAQADVISSFGIDSSGRSPGEDGFKPDTIEVEWETGILTSQLRGDGRFFPRWAWPLPGDRVWANGYWIFDCGHPVESTQLVPNTPIPLHAQGVRTEIHPPRAIASMRRRLVTPPAQFRDEPAHPIPATVADLYIHGRAGVVVDLLECGGRVILDNRTCQTRTGETPRGRDSSQGDPGHDIALDHVGIPIAEDFQFVVCMPPMPRGGPESPTPIVWQQRVTPDDTLAIPARFVLQDATGACAGPGYTKQVLVTVPLAGRRGITPDDVYARRIFAGWTRSPLPLRRLRVTVESLTLVDDMDHDGLTVGSDDCECAWFWTSVDKAPEKVRRLSDFADPNKDMNDLGDGKTISLLGATWNVLISDNEPFILRTFGFDGGVGEDANDPTQDCFDDHFGHHDLGAHVNFSLLNFPDLCYGGLALVSSQNMIDDPFDVIRHEFTAAEIHNLLGPWPEGGSASVTLESPMRCEVKYGFPGQANAPSKKVPCVSKEHGIAIVEAETHQVALDARTYHQYELAVRLEVLPTDSDADGVNDNDEVFTYGTDPLSTDTDHDGLTDGDEVHRYFTDPLLADTDADGLSDAAEVITHHTDPRDPDSDHDRLRDGLEVTLGMNPLDPDSDDDGLPDGRDPLFVKRAVSALPAAAFRAPENRNMLLARLTDDEVRVKNGRIAQAVQNLEVQKGRMDGCAAAGHPDDDDWIIDCAAQQKIRQLIDLLIANLGL